VVVRVLTAATNSIGAVPVDVEVQVTESNKDGKFFFSIVGLGDVAIRESRDRISSAIKSSGFRLPKKILVNLAPAELKKEGAAFDLPIALGILVGSNQINPILLKDTYFFGELSLDGRVKSVRGAVALAIEALNRKIKRVVCPIENLKESFLVKELSVCGVDTLTSCINEKFTVDIYDSNPEKSFASKTIFDVFGQKIAKRALIIAAAGGHNILMKGPPGCGKSMLAERFPTLLPKLSRTELLETLKIHSLSREPLEKILNGARPFRSPHHTVTDVGLTGGGNPLRPGEITLAHNGVLFLDELPEFRRSAIEALRSPLERQSVSITRAKARETFPSSFQLLAAMNTCPCGKSKKDCRCAPYQREAYINKISQPILDRIDIHVSLDPVNVEDIINMKLTSENKEKENIIATSKIFSARRIQLQRSRKLNSKIQNSDFLLEKYLTPGSKSLLRKAVNSFSISARSYYKILKVSRTIADMEESAEIQEAHLAEAVSLRFSEQENLE